MDSVAMFARRFYSFGYASGCAGCLIFVVVMYLDRLHRHPVQWSYFPRLEVWNMGEIRMAIKEDRFPNGGDFGQLGTLDGAYGEKHPTEARDTNGPEGSTKVERLGSFSVCYRGKGAWKRTPNKNRRCNSRNRSDARGAAISAHAEYGEEKTILSSGKDKMCMLTNVDPSCFRMDNLNRWISVQAVCTLQTLPHGSVKSTDFPCAVGRSFFSSMTGEVVLFAGGIGAECKSKGSIKRFLRSPCCAYLAIVSEVFAASFISSPLSSRVCVVKSGFVGDLFLIHSNSFSPNINVIKKRVGSVKDLVQEIQTIFFNHLSFADNTSNVMISKDLRCTHILER